GGASGGNVALGSGTLTTGDLNDATYSGVISGIGGALTKQGSGTFTLSSASTYTGATTVSAGTLAVNGSATSAVTVNSSATLAGTGTITGNVSNSGTVAPGNSPGVLTITGNYTQTTGGTLVIEIG